MSDQILVIEYEPRYTERIREALAGESVSLSFARDGDEALRVLANENPRLVILSSVIPRYGTADLVRQIRSRPGNQSLPILLTMSGYAGGNTRSDAARFGATDIIPKPFGPAELQSRVRDLLGSSAPAAPPPDVAPQAPPEPAATVRISTKDLVGEPKPEPEKPHRKSSVEDELDKMLAETLSGVRVPSVKKKTQEPDRAKEARRKDSTDELDKLLQDTLSGLEKRRVKPAEPEGEPPVPTPKVETPGPPRAPEPAAAGPVEPTMAPPEPVSPPEPAAPVEPAPAPPPPAPVSPTVLVRTPDQEEEIEPRKAPEPPSEEAEPDGAHFGQYVLTERIATGGMAEVWKARMRGVEGFEKLVAIKKILPHLSDNQEFVEMFVDEAKLAAQLNHNNIIHIYDLGKIADSYYIAMEFVDGHDLKSILRRAEEMDNPMPTELALSVASKLAAALDYAHRKRGFDDQDLGIVHRDVSPQNVLISYEGDIKLCDFGIAKAATKASHTQAGALKGKLLYMSPEQAWGRAIDRRSDIFSLAIVLFEMLTGRKLFTGESELSILDQVREARVTAPSAFNDELTREIDDLVLKGLAKEPENRYQTAGEMARAIDSVLFNYRPTPTAADLAIYMHRLYRMGAEPVLEPDLAPALSAEEAPPVEEDVYSQPTIQAPLAEMEIPLVTPVAEEPIAPAKPPATVQMPMADAMAEVAPAIPEGLQARTKKSRAPILIAALAVIAVAAVGGWYLTKGTGPSPPAVAPAAAKPVPTPKSVTPPPVPPTTTAITPEAAATENQPVLGKNDLALIDQEVKKRIAEERKRLDQQSKPVPAATPASNPAPRTAESRNPVPAEKPVETKPTAAAPQPAPAQPQSAPTTENAPATQTTPAEPAPTPAATPKPAVPQVKEGDLVQPGTPGLVEPSLLSIKKVAYPPLARQEQIQGTVFVRALVSETGRVLEAKILRGVRENVGINEAALEMVKGARFKPATIDGIRVKAYTTIPIPFKL